MEGVPDLNDHIGVGYIVYLDGFYCQPIPLNLVLGTQGQELDN